MSNYKEMPTQHELNALFRYCEETGNLIRKVDVGRKVKAGDVAGCKDNNGYISIKVNQEPYRAHRIIWVITYGFIDSKLQVDHINGVKDNNRLSNLRLVTRKDNLKNQKTPKNNNSGVIGVSWYKQKSKWQVMIRVDGKQKYIGRFTDKNEAIKARKAAEIEYNYHENHGRG